LLDDEPLSSSEPQAVAATISARQAPTTANLRLTIVPLPPPLAGAVQSRTATGLILKRTGNCQLDIEEAAHKSKFTGSGAKSPCGHLTGC
jgi:hypothetical protein